MVVVILEVLSTSSLYVYILVTTFGGSVLVNRRVLSWYQKYCRVIRRLKGLLLSLTVVSHPFLCVDFPMTNLRDGMAFKPAPSPYCDGSVFDGAQ